MKFNVNKCKVMHTNPSNEYSMNDKVLIDTEQERDLGITIHHNCWSHATKTAFIFSTTSLCLSIHLAVVADISKSWYQYIFSLEIYLDCVIVAETWAAMWLLSFW